MNITPYHDPMIAKLMSGEAIELVRSSELWAVILGRLSFSSTIR